MEARTCALCTEEKPISGVWYLLADGPGTFVCGSCFNESSAKPEPVAQP